MKYLSLITVLSTSLCLPAAANELAYYATFDVTSATLEPNDSLVELNPTALRIRGGRFLVSKISVEVQALAGISRGSEIIDNTEYDAKVDYIYGLYVKGYLPLADSIAVYALGGLANAELEIEQQTNNVTQIEQFSDYGFSFGAGAEIFLTPTWAISAEYMSYVDADRYELDGFSVGLVKAF